MSSDARRLTFAAAIMLIALGGAAWLWLTIGLARNHSAFFMQDWTVYYAAGTASRTGQVGLIYDGHAFTAYQYALLKPWFGGPPSLHPWLYPPLFLLLLAPLSALPFAVAYALFLLATGIAAWLALAWRGVGQGFAWRSALLLLAFPATCVDGLTGQNAMLSTALLVGGFRLIDARPAVAGALLRALTYKPQLFLMVPIALLASRAWRPLIFCALSAAVLALASAIVFGPQAWLLWLEQTVHGGDPSDAQWYAETFLTGYSVYVCAVLAGFAKSAAAALQLVASLAAAAAVWWVWRRRPGDDAGIAALLAATAAATPHLQAYDMMLIASAPLLLFVRAREEVGLAGLALLACVWFLPLWRPNAIPAGRYIIPVVLAALVAAAVAAARSTPTKAGKMLSATARA